jgi:hypothetical protein
MCCIHGTIDELLTEAEKVCIIINSRADCRTNRRLSKTQCNFNHTPSNDF